MFYILGFIATITLITAIRTINFKSKKFAVEPLEVTSVAKDKAAQRLSESIQIKTISSSDYSKVDWSQFEKFIQWIEQAYPKIHSKLQREIINDYSLLYRWKGKDASKKPILLMAHIDVVPIEEGTEQHWTYPPFSGAIKEGFVWGRGALDIKIQLVSIMEAVERLVTNGYTPQGDIYLAFGHDEEVGGRQGAMKIAQVLKERGLDFEYVLDEGGCVTEDGIKDIQKPIAVIGTGEKGYANVRLVSEQEGGHASMPPKNTALGEIAKAIVDLEKNQLKMEITKPVADMLRYVGPEMKLLNRIIIANLWLFKPLFKKVFSATASGNALLRTTTAATMAKGSIEPNILPQRASATFNFRIAPHETGKDLINHMKKVVGNDRIKIEPLRLEDPSKVSPVDSEGFRIIEKTVYQAFPKAIVSPYLVMAGTDARKYEIVSNNIYRFSPYQISLEELKKVHATDERISLDNIEIAVKFFVQLILNG